MLALASRRKGSAGGGIPAAFTGHLMTDRYTGCQHLPDPIARIQQCCTPSAGLAQCGTRSTAVVLARVR